MRRATLGQFRAVAGAQPVGICQGNLSDTAAVVNLAMEQLKMDPLAPEEGWWGEWATMVFNVTVTTSHAYIVAPHDIARLIVLDVCQHPIPIRNGFYEYLQFGSGLQPRACKPNSPCGPNAMQAYERDTVTTQTDFPSGPRQIRIFPTDNADLGKRIVLQGPDQNGATIWGTDTVTQAAILGETVYLKAPFATALNQYTGITGILKDQTNGPVQLFTVNPTTGVQTLLSSMDPNETTAMYRRYLVNGLPCGCCSTLPGIVQVTAQVRFDFVPVQSDSDYLCIANIPALIEQVQAIRYSRMDSPEAAGNEKKHHDRALSLLFGQLDLYEGKISTAVSVNLFGRRRGLRPQPR